MVSVIDTTISTSCPYSRQGRDQEQGGGNTQNRVAPLSSYSSHPPSGVQGGRVSVLVYLVLVSPKPKRWDG